MKVIKRVEYYVIINVCVEFVEFGIKGRYKHTAAYICVFFLNLNNILNNKCKCARDSLIKAFNARLRQNPGIFVY